LQIDQDKKSLVNIENSLQDVNIQLQDAIQAASTQNQELAILADKLTDAERNLKEEQTNLLGVRDEIQLLRDQRINYETELTKLLAEIEVIEYAEEKLIGYAEGTRILLQAARDSSVEGIIGSLDKKIKVSEELEVAINAALGEYIDAVIFHDGADISSDILLKQSTRGVLLPIDVMALDTIKLNKLLVDDDEFIGIASEFIECPRELKNIVGLLLGRVIIVRRRETALDIISKIKNNNQDFKNLTDYVDLRIVTLSGEVYCLTGPIIVDSQKASAKGQSLLSRKRHLESLAIKKKNIENKISNIENIITEILLHERELVVQVGSLEEAKFQSENCLETAKQKVNLISSNVDQLTDRLEWFKEQNQILEDKIKDNKADLDQITGDLSNLELRLNEANSQFKIKSTELAQIDYSETQVRVSHWEKELAVAEQSLKDLNTRFSDRSDRIRDMNLTLQSYQHRLSELNNTISLIIDERIGKTNQEVELEGKISDLQNKISPAESKLERLENSQFERQKEETAARKSFSSAEHRNAEARILLASRQDTLEALRRRIEEDIGLVDFEYGEHISGPTPLPIDGFVKELPIVVNLPSETEDSINRLRALLRRIGPINPEAETEYREINKRYTFLTEQVSDLRVAENNVRQVIDELDDIMEQEFNKTYSAVAEEFKEIFTRLFNGGSAHLVLTDSDNITEAGIDIEARLPGRRSQRLSLLSGGERSLTATALVFALLKVSPTPFCLLDEVDAMLDEANLIRFRELLEELSVETQFVVVTHNRNTVQAAKTIYGVTMGSDSVSQVISIKPDEIINDLS